MVRLCGFSRCFNREKRMRLRNRVSSRDEPVAFHRLPLRDPERLRLWLSAAGLDVDSPVTSLRAVRVCSEHFSPDDYRLKDPGGEVNSQRLKSTAVPRPFQPKTEDLHFCTQAGVCQRQNTEATLPELPEQHRIREKEEDPHGLESVYMAESETKCLTTGIGTLKPECVTGNSRVSDLHHRDASLIKTETDLMPAPFGDLKTESLDSADLGYEDHQHPDQIKMETDEGVYLKAAQISDWQDIESDHVKCDKANCEPSENMGTDPMSGVGLDHEDPVDPRLSAVHLNVNCNQEIHDPSTQHGNLNPCQFLNNEKNGNQIIQDSTKSVDKTSTSQRESMTIEPIKNPLNKAPIILTVPRKTVHINNGKIVERALKCTLCGKCFRQQYSLDKHLSTHKGDKSYKCGHCGQYLIFNFLI